MKKYIVTLKCNLNGDTIVIKETAESDDKAVEQAFNQVYSVLDLQDNDWKLHQLERVE